MTQFTAGYGKSVANLSQTLCLGQLAEKHGDILIPGRETLGMTFRLAVINQPHK
jgi:hypothetical protein